MRKFIYNKDVLIEYLPNRNIYYDIIYKPSRVIKFLRKNKNLTQGELAEMLKIDRMTISAWERNTSTPSAFNSKKILKYFKLHNMVIK